METFVLNFKSVSVSVQLDCVSVVPLSWLEDTLPASGRIEGAIAVFWLKFCLTVNLHFPVSDVFTSAFVCFALVKMLSMAFRR